MVTFLFLPAFGQANILQDEPTGIIDTCKNYLQTVAFVQSMIIGAAIFSSATWVYAIGNVGAQFFFVP